MINARTIINSLNAAATTYKPYYPSPKLVKKALKEAGTIGAIFYDFEIKLLKLKQIKSREGLKSPSDALINKFVKSQPVTPITVVRKGDGYHIVEGHHRYCAAKEASFGRGFDDMKIYVIVIK